MQCAQAGMLTQFTTPVEAIHSLTTVSRESSGFSPLKPSISDSTIEPEQPTGIFILAQKPARL